MNNNGKRQKDTKTLVRDIFIEHPEWNARQIYDRYLILVGDPTKAVTLNAVQKHVETYKGIANQPEYQALEKPWHLATTIEFPLPADVIWEILGLIDWARKHPEKLMLHRQMTVRQALWVCRLFGIKKAYVAVKNKTIKKPPFDLAHFLWQWSDAYACYEKACTLAGVSPDTTVLDAAIWEGAWPTSGFIRVGEEYESITLHYPDRRIRRIGVDNKKVGAK